MNQWLLKGDRPIKNLAKSKQTVMVMCCDRFFIGLVILLIPAFFSCEKRKELIDEQLYDGPQFSLDSVYTKISDSAKVIVRLKAPKQNNFENGNQEWPEGLYLEYLDGEGRVVSTFRSDYADFNQEEDLYKGTGNVEVVNRENGDKLNTEELFWNPKNGKFYTERFVTIETDGEIHTGEGLTSNQDFSSYEIHRPSGTLTLD